MSIMRRHFGGGGSNIIGAEPARVPTAAAIPEIDENAQLAHAGCTTKWWMSIKDKAISTYNTVQQFIGQLRNGGRATFGQLTPQN